VGLPRPFDCWWSTPVVLVCSPGSKGTASSRLSTWTDSELKGEGLALLTASSANEDAQESDELKGSFFSHALISGLLGAADSNGDGDVVLEEAYHHAYESTLRATSRHPGGPRSTQLFNTR